MHDQEDATDFFPKLYKYSEVARVARPRDHPIQCAEAPVDGVKSGQVSAAKLSNVGLKCGCSGENFEQLFKIGIFRVVELFKVRMSKTQMSKLQMSGLRIGIFCHQISVDSCARRESALFGTNLIYLEL